MAFQASQEGENRFLAVLPPGSRAAGCNDVGGILSQRTSVILNGLFFAVILTRWDDLSVVVRLAGKPSLLRDAVYYWNVLVLFADPASDPRAFKEERSFFAEISFTRKSSYFPKGLELRPRCRYTLFVHM
jgi:hypothetical protein